MFQFLKMFAVVAMINGLSFGTAQAQSTEIQSAIGSQIDAFQIDDFETAFGFASPTLQRLFGSPQNFQSMVIRGYPMVWRPAEVRYLELAEVNGNPFQKVLIKDLKGVVHILGYLMLKTDMGWKINGVQLLPAPDVSA